MQVSVLEGLRVQKLKHIFCGTYHQKGVKRVMVAVKTKVKNKESTANLKKKRLQPLQTCCNLNTATLIRTSQKYKDTNVLTIVSRSQSFS